MRDLKWIEKANKPGAGRTGSRDPIPRAIEFHAPEHTFDVPEAPPMFKYVKETFNVPATWWDHLKLTIRCYAAVHFGERGYWIVSRLFRGIKSTRIPVVYEIHARPKIIPRVKGRAK